MHRKKILWLVSWYPNRKDKYDGDFVQRHAYAAAIYNDIHVLFVTDLPDLSNEEILEDIHYATGLTEQLVYFKTPTGLFKKITKQLRWLRLNKKLVHKYIQENGRPDLVHVHVPWKAGLVALWVKKKWGIPFIITEHWTIYHKNDPHSLENKSKYFRSTLGKIFNSAMIYLPVSDNLGASISSYNIKALYKVIPNVTDTTLFFHKENHEQNSFVFLHVSNMSPQKNVNGILKAFHKLTQSGVENVRLVFVGNRDNYYIKKAESFGLLNKTVFFKGEISYRDVAEEMQRANCFVLNSNIENAPCVISEALCCGLPIITTMVGGISEMVDETNSIAVAVNDSASLAIAMQKMIGQYADFNQKMIAARGAKKYGYATVSEQFDEVYKSIAP